jgi:hypothetical protein
MTIDSENEPSSSGTKNPIGQDDVALKKSSLELSKDELTKPREDYTTFSVDILRKMLSSRNLKGFRTAKKPEVIQQLKNYDAARAGIISVGGTVSDPVPIVKAPIRTKHCNFRLLNILFHDRFATDFATIGDTATRAELDKGETNANNPFWERVKYY